VKWSSGFSKPFKQETFVLHGKSKTHCDNVTTLKANISPSETPLAKSIKRMDHEMFLHLNNLFNIAYYIAKSDKPFKDFENLLSLAGKLNVSILKQYGNEKQCRNLVCCIADILKQELAVKLKCSKYISILIHGSTDITEEHANVYVRYVDTNDGSVREDIFLTPLLQVTSVL
jgi:hypothetical protein